MSQGMFSTNTTHAKLAKLLGDKFLDVNTRLGWNTRAGKAVPKVTIYVSSDVTDHEAQTVRAKLPKGSTIHIIIGCPRHLQLRPAGKYEGCAIAYRHRPDVPIGHVHHLEGLEVVYVCKVIDTVNLFRAWLNEVMLWQAPKGPAIKGLTGKLVAVDEADVILVKGIKHEKA